MNPNTQEDHHWQLAQSYVGREYVPGHYDCAHLAIDVQREVFGRQIALPACMAEHRLGRAGQAAQIRAASAELATRVQEPVHGGAVLITTPVDTGLQWHIGTVFVRDAEVWVLHNSHTMGSACLSRLRDFAWRGQRIEGFYAWK